MQHAWPPVLYENGRRLILRSGTDDFRIILDLDRDALERVQTIQVVWADTVRYPDPLPDSLVLPRHAFVGLTRAVQVLELVNVPTAELPEISPPIGSCAQLRVTYTPGFWAAGNTGLRSVNVQTLFETRRVPQLFLEHCHSLEELNASVYRGTGLYEQMLHVHDCPRLREGWPVYHHGSVASRWRSSASQLQPARGGLGWVEIIATPVNPFAVGLHEAPLHTLLLSRMEFMNRLRVVDSTFWSERQRQDYEGPGVLDVWLERLAASMRVLTYTDNAAAVVPEWAQRLSGLTELHLQHNRITDVAALNDALRHFPKLTRLDLSHNTNLRVMPDLAATPLLEELRLSNVGLRTLPGRGQWPRALRVLDVSDNEITLIADDALLGVPLERLDVSHNPLRRLPLLARTTDETVTRPWKTLHKIVAHHTMLVALPDSFRRVANQPPPFDALELLDIRDTPLFSSIMETEAAIRNMGLAEEIARSGQMIAVVLNRYRILWENRNVDWEMVSWGATTDSATYTRYLIEAAFDPFLRRPLVPRAAQSLLVQAARHVEAAQLAEIPPETGYQDLADIQRRALRAVVAKQQQ